MFSLALAAVMALVFLLAAALTGGSGKSSVVVTEPAVAATGIDKLISSNETLQQKLTALQQLDGQYAASLTDTAAGTATDSLDKLILLEEGNFKTAVAAAGEEANSLPEGDSKTRFEKMIAAYQSLIESRRSAGMLRNIMAVKSGSLGSGEKQLLGLQNELEEKSSRIASLERALEQMKNRPPAVVKDNSGNAALQQHIEALESKMAALSTLNTGLKQDNERLQQLQGDMKKTAGSSEQLLKEKNLSLQQRIDDLTAEIQLVKVDCNLNRVDATQIISNAKQRRQLLTEASDILTHLSASNNAEISRKVKEKVNKLNRVAGNYRE